MSSRQSREGTGSCVVVTGADTGLVPLKKSAAWHLMQIRAFGYLVTSGNAVGSYPSLSFHPSEGNL